MATRNDFRNDPSRQDEAFEMGPWPNTDARRRDWDLERPGHGRGGYRGDAYSGYPYGPAGSGMFGYGNYGDYDRYGRSFSREDLGNGRDDRGPFERMGDRLKEGWQRMIGKGPKGYTRSDERIRDDVCDRLMQGWVNAENVEVTVEKGEVTLAGQVEHRQDKRAIEDIAESVLGVTEIHNQLRVDRQAGQRTEPSRNSATTGRGRMTQS